MRLFLSPDVTGTVAPPDAAAAKVSAEAALKIQNEQAMQKAAADQKAQQDAGAAKMAADKATADAAAQAAAKAVADSKANQDKAAADAKAKADASGSTPWDATGDKKEPTPEEKAAAEAAKLKADGEKKFELKVPDGAKMEAAQLAKFADEAKALGVTQEQAQKLLERDISAQKAQDVAIQGQLKANDQMFVKTLQTEWGDKFAENSEFVKRGFEDFDPSGKIRAGLKAAGLINWPEAVRAMERHGRRMAEDKLFSPTTGKAADPKMTPEQKIKAQYAQKQAGQK